MLISHHQVAWYCIECRIHATSCPEICIPERITHGCSISRNSITPRYVRSHTTRLLYFPLHTVPTTYQDSHNMDFVGNVAYIMIWNLRRIPADKHKISFTLMKSITYVIVQLFVARTAIHCTSIDISCHWCLERAIKVEFLQNTWRLIFFSFVPSC